jgi:Ser/Thr protein kinase RdoA (MazF antagonist)
LLVVQAPRSDSDGESSLEILKTEHLREATGLWDATGVEPSLISDVENFVYSLTHQGEERILRLTHSSHRTADLVRGELEWMDYLHRNGVSVARSIPSAAGRLVEVIAAGETCFIATLFEKAKGTRVRSNDPEVWNERLFRNWGRALGRMHALTHRYEPSDPVFRRPQWDADDLLVHAERYLPPEDGAAREALAECLAWPGALPREPDGYGLVHRDVHHVLSPTRGESLSSTSTTAPTSGSRATLPCRSTIR